jgi:succinate-semialdehyde dehydrogenase/glutarate-semialdehyde dehydrogenase
MPDTILPFAGCGDYSKGLFYKPTVLADATPDMLIMREETFGPAVGVAPFDTVDEAIALANDTQYGLAAIVYTGSLNTAHKAAMSIRAGNVAINNPDPGVLNAPYGGWRDSGFGCEHGPEGLMEYMHIKHIRTRYY